MLQLTGKRLDLATTAEDYSVTVERLGMCNVTNLTESTLDCRVDWQSIELPSSNDFYDIAVSCQ